MTESQTAIAEQTFDLSSSADAVRFLINESFHGTDMRFIRRCILIIQIEINL